MRRVTPWACVFALACAAQAGCTKGRTQLMVGLATDLTVPGNIDRVELVAEREGVPVVEHSWRLASGAEQGVELPASFGVFSEGGNEPRLSIEARALRGDKLVVSRRAVLSLVEGKTLFLRLALVWRCSGIVCGEGETCVEGACASAEIDPATLPVYEPGMESELDCVGTTQLLNTRTGAPMKVSGKGACSGGAFCGEGQCRTTSGSSGPDLAAAPDLGAPDLLAPDLAPPPEIAGHYYDITSSETNPAGVVLNYDLSGTPVRALVPQGSGYVTYTGIGRADGTFSVYGVPVGPYLLQIGQMFSEHQERTLDLGYLGLARSDVARPSVSQGIRLTASGLDPWQTDDVLSVASPTTGFWSGVMAPNPPALVGSSSDIVDLLLRDLSRGFLTKWSHGDHLYVSQLRAVSAAGVYQLGMVRNHVLEVELSDGVDETISGVTFSTPSVPLSTLSLQVARQPFHDLMVAAHPNAQYWANYGKQIDGPTVELVAWPGDPALGVRQGSSEQVKLAKAMAIAPGADLNVSVPYYDLLPPSWARMISVQVNFQVPYSLPGSTQPFSYNRILGLWDHASALAGTSVSPTLSPVQSPTVDGVSLAVDQAIDSTPLLAWSSPAVGQPSRSYVSVSQAFLDAQSRTQMSTVATFCVLGNSLRVPAGLLQSGKTYVVVIDAVATGDPDADQRPYWRTAPLAYAPTFSGFLTVTGP